jgi:hypothetical protein
MKLKADYYMTYEIHEKGFINPKQTYLLKTFLYLDNIFVRTLPVRSVRIVCKEKTLFNTLFIYDQSPSYVTFAIENSKKLVLLKTDIIHERDEDVI